MVDVLPNAVQRAAYRTQQFSMLAPALATQRILRVVARRKMARLVPDVEKALRERYDALLATDLKNVEDGLYPRSLLFQIPVAEYALRVPEILKDLPRTLRRVQTQNYRDFPGDVDVHKFPAYFRRNFHWQTDGYFSRRSAELYDVGVEFLFLGTADIMRRQIIPPITKYLRGLDVPRSEVRLLDVATGTGRGLKQVVIAHPDLRYYASDLSPFYLQYARKLLRHHADVSFAAENAENLPFKDNLFDILTNVYLFHELPKPARANVVREMHRVLKPGGLLVIEDSAQYAESAQIAPILEQFAADFHEPFYRDYVRDDLSELLRKEGFEVESANPHFVAKVLVARKKVPRAKRSKTAS